MGRIAIRVLVLCAAACAPGAGSRVDGAAADVLERNRAAVESLSFGMSEAETAAIMGNARIAPPWANAAGVGPQTVGNPFDAFEVEAESGDRYRVQRYAVGLWGQPDCPFVRGEIRFVPLIFLDEQLVGWRWSYLESALDRPLRAEERGFQFGGFCNAPASGPVPPPKSPDPQPSAPAVD